MYSAVIRASDSLRGVKVTEFETGQLKRLVQQLAEIHQEENLLAVEKGSTSNCVYDPPP